jgi:hypothetical protein
MSVVAAGLGVRAGSAEDSGSACCILFLKFALAESGAGPGGGVGFGRAVGALSVEVGVSWGAFGCFAGGGVAGGVGVNSGGRAPASGAGGNGSARDSAFNFTVDFLGGAPLGGVGLRGGVAALSGEGGGGGGGVGVAAARRAGGGVAGGLGVSKVARGVARICSSKFFFCWAERAVVRKVFFLRRTACVKDGERRSLVSALLVSVARIRSRAAWRRALNLAMIDGFLLIIFFVGAGRPCAADAKLKPGKSSGGRAFVQVFRQTKMKSSLRGNVIIIYLFLLCERFWRLCLELHFFLRVLAVF